MSDADIRISRTLQALAGGVEATLQRAAGRPVLFSLWVWTDGRAQYVSNADRASVVAAMREALDRWEAGQPDVPQHEQQ